MTRKVTVLPEADRDIDEAFAWYVGEANPEVALRFLDAVHSAIGEVLQTPGKGRRWPFRRTQTQELRSSRLPTFKRYLIFYREVGDGVEVIRVLHGMRDIERLLDEQA